MAVNNPDPNAEPGGDSSPPAELASLPQQTQDYIRGLRTENAKYRTRARDTEAQLKAMGDAPQQIRSLKLAVALRDQAAADPEMLEFFLRKEGKWDDLDGNDVDVLRDRVDDLLARRPDLKQRKGPPTTRSGPDLPRGPGDANPGGQLTRGQLHGMTPEQVERHFREGNLDQVLGRQR